MGAFDSTVVRSLVLVVALAAASATSPAAAAYPEHLVRIVVPYVAGGPTDTAARIVAAELGKRTGQSFVVENRGGAAGNIGAEFVARSAPDGYTLVVIGAAHAINKSLYKKLSYDIERDFVPIATFSTAPEILLANPTTKVRSVADLVAAAKARPGSFDYCSAGIGTAPHLTMELLKTKAGIDLRHVPYKGSTPGLIDLMGGQVQFCFDSVIVWQTYMQNGKLRALAVTSPKRSDIAPDVPTMAEAGYPQVDVSLWYGLAAPSGTPDAVVQYLNAQVGIVLNDPDVQHRLRALGSDPLIESPGQFRQFLGAEVKRWADVVKESGAEVE